MTLRTVLKEYEGRLQHYRRGAGLLDERPTHLEGELGADGKISAGERAELRRFVAAYPEAAELIATTGEYYLEGCAPLAELLRGVTAPRPSAQAVDAFVAEVRAAAVRSTTGASQIDGEHKLRRETERLGIAIGHRWEGFNSEGSPFGLDRQALSRREVRIVGLEDAPSDVRAVFAPLEAVWQARLGGRSDVPWLNHYEFNQLIHADVMEALRQARTSRLEGLALHLEQSVRGGQLSRPGANALPLAVRIRLGMGSPPPAREPLLRDHTPAELQTRFQAALQLNGVATANIAVSDKNDRITLWNTASRAIHEELHENTPLQHALHRAVQSLTKQRVYTMITAGFPAGCGFAVDAGPQPGTAKIRVLPLEPSADVAPVARLEVRGPDGQSRGYAADPIEVRPAERLTLVDTSGPRARVVGVFWTPELNYPAPFTFRR
jgi:hypothetical protein